MIIGFVIYFKGFFIKEVNFYYIYYHSMSCIQYIFLSRNPSLGGICILPNETLQYQEDECLLFMMETYCRENIIPIIKVCQFV